MSFRIGAAAIALTAAALAGAPAAAKEKDAGEPAGKATAFQAVLDCRGVTDNAQRLACYDAAAGRMSEAETKGDIVVIDRAQASAAHREAFGLQVPSLAFVTRALKPEEVDRIEGVVDSARSDVNGRWTLKLQDGAVWRQISGDLLKAPHSGSKVAVRKGSLGSFLMNVDGQPSIKVHRDE
jgi:hypothetical protein